MGPILKKPTDKYLSPTEWHESEKPDLDLHQSRNLRAAEAQNGALEGGGRSIWRRGDSKWVVGTGTKFLITV